MQTVLMRLEGMSCAGCAQSVGKLLATVAGVAAHEVDWESGELRLQMDEEQMDLSLVVDTLAQGGFDVVECELL